MPALIHFDALLSSTVQGPKGDQGDQGPQGVTGEQGPQGPVGPAGEVEMPQLYLDTTPGALTANYRHMIMGSGNMEFELPVAAGNVGAVVSVTDVSGTARDIVISTAGGFSEVIHAPAGAATMTAAYSSRTFVAVPALGLSDAGWVVTSSVGA